MSIELVMQSNHLILCWPLLFLSDDITLTVESEEELKSLSRVKIVFYKV